MIEPLRNSRFTLDRNSQGTRIRFKDCPSRFGKAAFLGFWLCGWAVGEFTVGGMLVNTVGQWLGLVEATATSTPEIVGFLFSLFWLCGWTVGGAMAFAQFASTLYGSPRLVLRRKGGVVVERLGRSSQYAASSLCGVRWHNDELIFAGRNTENLAFPALTEQERNWLLDGVLSTGVVQEPSVRSA